MSVVQNSLILLLSPEFMFWFHHTHLQRKTEIQKNHDNSGSVFGFSRLRQWIFFCTLHNYIWQQHSGTHTWLPSITMKAWRVAKNCVTKGILAIDPSHFGHCLTEGKFRAPTEMDGRRMRERKAGGGHWRIAIVYSLCHFKRVPCEECHWALLSVRTS